MPVAVPAAWTEQRLRWESDPAVTLADVARALGVSKPTVTLRARRELWVRSEVIEPKRLTYTPRELVEVAVRALVRAALQTSDHASAVKAAGMLLDRTMGRVAAVQEQPMVTPAQLGGSDESAAWPEWLKSRRLAYQEATQAPDDGFGPPEVSETEKPPIDAPSIAAQAPSPIAEPFRPRLVPAEPRFWAGPGRPAS